MPTAQTMLCDAEARYHSSQDVLKSKPQPDKGHISAAIGLSALGSHARGATVYLYVVCDLRHLTLAMMYGTAYNAQNLRRSQIRAHGREPWRRRLFTSSRPLMTISRHLARATTCRRLGQAHNRSQHR